jgi:hypothetical protein
MPGDMKSLNNLFNNALFRVPDYQRGYAWTTRQLEDFWQDLVRLTEDRKHYTGQLTLESVKEPVWKNWEDDAWLIRDVGFTPYYVVDGQQRLTTSIILLKCLIDRVGPTGTLAHRSAAEIEKQFLVYRSGELLRTCLFGYEKDNPSHEYLKTQILGLPSVQNQQTRTLYTANLAAACEFFAARLKDATPDELERWYRALTQRFLFNIHELGDDLDVFVAFETMNNRGKPLSKLELLKNRLIYLSTLLPAPVTPVERQLLRRDINDAWKTAYEFLGRVEEQALDDDEFLRAHWIMYYPYVREDSWEYESVLLNRKFTAKSVLDGALKAADLHTYVRSIQSSVRTWHAMHFPAVAAGIPDEAKPWIERLGRLRWGAFGPLAMAALQTDSWGESLVRLLTAAERFRFVINRLCRLRADTGDSRFYRMAEQLHHGTPLDEITERIQASVTEFFSLDRFKYEIKAQKHNFYEWHGIRYFLFEYEQHLRHKAAMQAEKLDWIAFTSVKGDNVSIEHIFPQNPKLLDWPDFDPLPETRRSSLCHSLGNLLALSTSRNSKLSNRPFKAKCDDSKAVIGYRNGSYSEIAVARQPDWTPDDIIARGLEMLRFMEQRWNISLGSDADKQTLLGV